MESSYRKFQAGPDPFGRIWDVEFQWLQTAISIRHSDSVDVKFVVWTEGKDGQDAEPKQERVIALRHPDLLEATQFVGHKLTDPFCGKIAALHLAHMIETFEDMDKTLVTCNLHDVKNYARELTEGQPVS